MKNRANYVLFACCYALLSAAGCNAGAPVAINSDDGDYAPPPPGYAPAANDVGGDSSDVELILQSKIWFLRTYSAEGTEHRLTLQEEIDLRFTSDQRISGGGGCNGYFSSYRLGPGDALSFGQLARSRKMCANANMVLENAYLDLLGRVSSYRLESDGLRLFDDQKRSQLFFTPE